MYRYFGTKEGLLVADEFDSTSQEALEGILDVNDPVGSLLEELRPDDARRVYYDRTDSPLWKIIEAAADVVDPR